MSSIENPSSSHRSMDTVSKSSEHISEGTDENSSISELEQALRQGREEADRALKVSADLHGDGKDIPSAQSLRDQFEMPVYEGKQGGETANETTESNETSPSYLEKMKDISLKFAGAIKQGFEYLVLKPAVWVARKVKEHPYIAIGVAIAILAVAGYWYLSVPVGNGLSAIPEAGVKEAGRLVEEALKIDPTRMAEVMSTR